MATSSGGNSAISGKLGGGEAFRTTARPMPMSRTADLEGRGSPGQGREQGSIWLYMLYNSLPFLLILGISFFVMRQMQKNADRARWASARAGRGC